MKLPQQRFLRLLCRQPLLPPQSLTTHTHRCTHTHWQPQFSCMQQRKHHKGNYYASLFVHKGRNAFHVSFRSLCHFQQIWGSWMCHCCEAWLIAAGASESSCTHMHQLRAIWSQFIRAGKIPQKTGCVSCETVGPACCMLALCVPIKALMHYKGLTQITDRHNNAWQVVLLKATCPERQTGHSQPSCLILKEQTTMNCWASL